MKKYLVLFALSTAQLVCYADRPVLPIVFYWPTYAPLGFGTSRDPAVVAAEMARQYKDFSNGWVVQSEVRDFMPAPGAYWYNHKPNRFRFQNFVTYADYPNHYGDLTFYVESTVVCPTGYSMSPVIDLFSQNPYNALHVCSPVSSVRQCKGTLVGDPIQVESRTKLEKATDYQVGRLKVTRNYRSTSPAWNFQFFTKVSNNKLTEVSNLANSTQSPPGCRPLSYFNPSTNTEQTECFSYASNSDLGLAGTSDLTVTYADGLASDFSDSGLSTSIGAVESAHVQNDGAGNYTGAIIAGPSGQLDTFDATGRLTASTDLSGGAVRYTYLSPGGQKSPNDAPNCLRTAIGPADPNLPSCATDSISGRQVTFIYGVNGKLASAIDPAGRSINYSYDGPTAITLGTPTTGRGILTDITYQDGTSRKYWYNEQDRTSGTDLPFALTGIADELGVKFSRTNYAANGSAIATDLIGSVDSFSIAGDVVTDPMGVQRTHRSSQVSKALPSTKPGFPNGVTFSTLVSNGINQPGGSGCNASSSQITYDSSANVATRDDFNGYRTCFAHDLARNVETSRVEGLLKSTNCANINSVGVALPDGSRKISTQWHPKWRLEVARAEPKKLTTSVYNGQPDPFNGGAIASCAPSSAILPDGSPIAVLCKRVEQATLDTDGRLGFTAALQAGVANRVQAWTYNQFGQVLTAKGPRTDVNDTTSYVYYTASSADRAVGDLQSVTNAAGKTTTFDKYDAHGLLLQSTDPNGLITINTYDLRQRLLSVQVGNEITRYGYDLAGQLTSVTMPNGATVTNTYDDAHRLTEVSDTAGNKIVYTLDAAGNRIGEKVEGPGGVLLKNITRSFDALNRLQRVTGAPQ